MHIAILKTIFTGSKLCSFGIHSSTHLSSKVILVTRQPFVVKTQKSHQENKSCEHKVAAILDDNNDVHV